MLAGRSILVEGIKIPLKLFGIYKNIERLGDEAVKYIAKYEPEIEIKNNLLSNEEVRDWYIDSLSRKITEIIEGEGSLREKALKAFQLRNELKMQAREMMADIEKRDRLPDPETLKSYVEDKYSAGIVGDDLWRRMLESSRRSNKQVDDSLGKFNPYNSHK